jgi:hypothetical protein
VKEMKNIEIISVKNRNHVRLVTYSNSDGVFETRIYEKRNELKIDDEVYKLIKEKRFLHFITKETQQEIINRFLQLEEYRVRNAVHPYHIEYMESSY